MSSHRVSVRLLLALAATLCAHPVRATEPPVASPPESTRADSTATLGVADTVTVLAPVRVDADRPGHPERASATTARLERSDLVRFQPSTAGDALLGTPGLDVARTGPWSSNLSLRGLGGERVLVLVDGVRLQSGRGHGAQTSLVSVDRLEAVEVLPGAGGVQYGSDALGGVVELVTHRELLGPRRSALTLTGRTSGPGNERSAQARVRVLSPRVGAEVSAGWGGLDALVTPDGRVPNSSYHERELNVRTQARLAGSTLDLERTQHTARDVQVPAFDDGAGSHAEYPLQNRIAHRLEWRMPGQPRRPELRLLGVQQQFRTAFVETSADSQFVRGQYAALRTTRADDRLDTRSSSVQPSIRAGLLRLAGEYRHESTRGPRTTGVSLVNSSGAQTSATTSYGESVPPARRDVLAGGAFAPIAWRALRLELGARFDWLRSRADSTPQSFTPTLDVTDRRWSFEGGAAWAVGAWTPYGRVASGFRAPNLEERYFDDGFHGGMRLFGNPALRAERTRTVEFGVRTSEPRSGALRRARLSVYRSNVDDLITLRYLGQLYLVPRFQYTNVRRAVLEGAELQAESAVGPWRLAANAAAPRGRDADTGAPIPDVGATRASLDARWAMPTARVTATLGLRARWTDASVQDDPQLSRPAFWTADAEGTAMARGTRLAVAVRNLTHTRHREPLGFIDEPGRHLAISLRQEWNLPW